MNMVRAQVATLTAPRVVSIFEREVVGPGKGEVRLRTLYSGISAGTEMNVYRGFAAQWSTKRDPDTGLFEPTGDPEWTYPMAYGYAAVSTVEELGDGVTQLSVGDIVYSYTAHQSWNVVPASSTIKLPPLDDVRTGVLNANVNTAYNGVLDAHPRLGDVVVVSGLGVVGLIVLQLLKKLGVYVIAVDGVDQRRDLATRFGADVTLKPGADVASTVRRLTDNRGADIVIEVSGASAALNEAIRIVGYCGRVIAMSWYGGTFENLSLVGEFHHNRPQIISSQVGGLSPTLGPLWSLARRQDVANSLLQELDLTPLITHELHISEAHAAYELVDSRPNDLVQCLLTYDAPTSQEGK